MWGILSMAGKTKNELRAGDLFALRVISEEGLLLGRIYDQSCRSQDSTAVLTFSASPLISLIEHDAIRFLNEKLKAGLPLEPSWIARMRHLAKSLNSHLEYSEYSRQANAIIEQLGIRFKKHIGPLGTFKNSIQPDIAMAYFDGIPLCSNYTVAHFLTTDDYNSLEGGNGQYARGLGYDLGVTGSPVYHLARGWHPEAVFRVPSFAAQYNDLRYSELILPLNEKGVGDRVCFFFFSELLILMSSVDALARLGYLSGLAYLKFEIVTLDHAFMAISKFSSYVRVSNSGMQYPPSFLEEIGSLISREDRKWLNKSRRLRNAFVHYDFSKYIDDAAEVSSLSGILNGICLAAMGQQYKEYCAFLTSVREKLMNGIKGMIGFPEYDSAKDPMWHDSPG